MHPVKSSDNHPSARIEMLICKNALTPLCSCFGKTKIIKLIKTHNTNNIFKRTPGDLIYDRI